MADANSTAVEKLNTIPLFKVKLNDGAITDLELPEGTILGNDVYALNYSGNDWTGKFLEGDLVFVDPNQIPLAGDYVAIYPKGRTVAAIEQMALSFMPGKTPHPDSNVVAVLSIKRPSGMCRTVECSKLEKVHKVIGKAHTEGLNHDPTAWGDILSGISQ